MSGENEENINQSLLPLALCPKKTQHGRGEKKGEYLITPFPAFSFYFAHTLCLTHAIQRFGHEERRENVPVETRKKEK